MKKYLLSKEELIDLLVAKYRLEALEDAGVDNWSWYGDNFVDWIAERLGLECQDVIDNDIDFEDVAKNTISLGKYLELKQVPTKGVKNA